MKAKQRVEATIGGVGVILVTGLVGARAIWVSAETSVERFGAVLVLVLTLAGALLLHRFAKRAGTEIGDGAYRR